MVGPVTVTGLPAGCTIATARYTLYVTSDVDVSSLITGTAPFVEMDIGDYSNVMVALIDNLHIYGNNVPSSFSGLTVGTSCGALQFVAGAPSFYTASPPYDGTYAPAADVLVGASTASVEGLTLAMWVSGGGGGALGHATLVCWSMQLTFR